jgi:hypothetical protein
MGLNEASENMDGIQNYPIYRLLTCLSSIAKYVEWFSGV